MDAEQSNIGRTFGQYVITRYRYSDETYTASYYDAVCNQCHSVVLLRVDLHRDTAGLGAARPGLVWLGRVWIFVIFNSDWARSGMACRVVLSLGEVRNGRKKSK